MTRAELRRTASEFRHSDLLGNVLEHIADLGGALSRAQWLLKPGGLVYIVCPNYFAWRLEAHYHVPWKPNPLLPMDKAVDYLRSLGHDPSFFENCIFRRTNWEVLGALRRLHFEPLDMTNLNSRLCRFRTSSRCFGSR